jgi:hypothetical protein
MDAKKLECLSKYQWILGLFEEDEEAGYRAVLI